MARHLSEMMLIVRAQNQASGALRRVGKDLSALGRHRQMQIRQQRLLLNQQNLMRQGLRAQRELSSITQGSRAIQLQRAMAAIEKQRGTITARRNQLLHDQANVSRAIANAQARLSKISNDQFRRETQQIRLLNREKKAQAAIDARVRERRSMLRSRGGLENVPKRMNADSLRGIENARGKLSLLQRMLQSNVDRQGELAKASNLTSRAIQDQIARSGLLGRRYAETGKAAKDLDDRTRHVAARHAELAARANEVRAQMRDIASRYQIVTAQQKQLSNQMRVARWDTLSTAGRTIQHLGRVGQYATLVLGGGLAYAAHNAAMFEKQATLVATQTGKIGTGMGTVVKNSKFLQRAFLNIQADGTSSMEDINAAAYNLFSTIDQLGDSKKGLGQGAKMMKLFSDAAIAGQAPITDVAEGVIGVLSAFTNIAPTAANVERILNRMFATVRFGRMSFSELNESLTTLTPAAKSAGQTLDTVLGTFAFLSKPLGVAKARVGIPRLMEVLTRPKMVEGLKKLGIQVADSKGKMFQLDKIIGNIVSKRPDITKSDLALMQFFKTVGGAEGTVMARRAFVFLAKDLQGYRRILNKVKNDNNEFDRSLKAMEGTTGVRWEKFLNQLRALALMIGANVLPEILKLAPHIQKMVDWFQRLDPATRETAVHFTVMAVAILGVASAFAFILGPLIRLVALLGKARMATLGMAALFIGISAGIAILSGNWDGLNTIINDFFGLTNHGTLGWVAMFAIAATGALKLASALKTVRNAWIASSIAQSAGMGAGGLAGVFGGGRNMMANLKALPKAAQGATKLRTVLGMASLAAMAIPGPLWIAGGAIAAAAAGALLWKRHMDDVAKKAEILRVAQMKYVSQASRPQTQAADFGKTGDRIVEARKLGIELQRQKLTLKDLQAQYRAASGNQKKLLGLDIQDQLIRIAEYTRMYADAQTRAKNSGMQLTNTIISQAHNIEMYKARQEEIKKVEQQLAALRAKPSQRGDGAARMTAIDQLQNKLRGLKGALLDIEARSRTTGQILRTSFGKIIADLQKGALLPGKIQKGAMDAALKVALGRGKMLTIPEIKAVIKAYADKGALAKARADIQAAVKTVKVDIRIGKLEAKRTDLKGALRAAMHSGDTDQVAKIRAQLTGVEEALKNSRTARAKIARIFGRRITQHVNVKVHPANTEPLGRAISTGLAQGIINGMPSVTAAVNTLVAEANRAARAKAEIKSPSKLFERTVGQPIVRGIIKGLLNKNEIQRSAALMIDLFNGAFLQAKQQKIDAIGDNKEFDPLKLRKYEQQAKDALARFKKTHKAIDKIRAAEYEKKAKLMRGRKGLGIDDLIKDAKGQVQAMVTFNQSLAKLKKRGVPVGLLNDLRALGIDGLKYIKILANATPVQLKKYTQAWNQMQGQIRKSQFKTLDDIKNWKQATLDQLKEFKESAANKLLDTWNELHSIAENNMGPLFQGLEDKIGDGFQSALDEWKSQVDDYRSQIEEMQGEIRSVYESMGQALGQLFAGDFLQNDAGVANKREWGAALGFDDLFADLEGQVDKFNKWRSLLTSLAGKVPAQLAQALEALGPDAVESLQALDGATSEQLAKYVATWEKGQDAIGAATINATKDLAYNIQGLTDVIANLAAPKPLSPEDVLKSIQNQINAFDQFEGTLQELRRKGLPEELIKQLAQMGPEALPYLQALNSMTKGQLTQFESLWETSQQRINSATDRLMQDQLNMWYSHGANIASAIIAGVASEQQGLLNFFGNLFENLLKGKFPNMPGSGAGGGTGGGGAVSLSGGNTNYGPPDPWMVAAGLAGPTAKSSPASLTQAAPQTNVTIGPVYAMETESLEQVLSRSAFNVRNTIAD